MKKQISNIFRFFLIMIFAMAVASCSFWSDSIEEKESTTTTFVPGGLAGSKGTFTVSGTIGISEGAFPSSIVNAVNDKRSSRAAMPQIPSSLTYSVTASDGTNEVAGINSGDNNYQMTLECGKDWTVSVLASDSNGIPVLSDTWTIPADNTEANLSHNFYVKPAASASGTGTLALTIVLNNDLDGLVSKVTADCKSVANMDDWEVLILPDEDITFPADSSVSVSISDDTIASDQYEVSFNFYNDSNVLVYNTVQTINIFDNLTTNTWVSGNSSGPIKSDGTFELTKTLVDGYARTHLYVGETNFTAAKADDYNGNGTAAKPFASVTGAINYLKKVGSAEKDYTIYVVGTVAGAQRISDITDDGNGNQIVKTIPAHSITLEGFNGLDDNDVPQDVLNGGLDEDNDGQTLLISTSIPVTIKNLTITGGYQFNNYGAGISVSGDSKVYLEDGTLITGNHSEAAGAAIGIIDSATVTMNGGSIENNTSAYEYEGFNGSGTVLVYKEYGSEVTGNPKFILNGGTIKKNKTIFYGGGVGVVSEGEFEMNGGTIGGTSDEDANIADSSDSSGYANGSSTYGGGVYVGSGGSFKMNGGVISHNKAPGIGTDTMNNGTHDNCGGGGVAVCEGGSFEMKAVTLNGVSTAGEISSNTSGRNGGGVYIDSSSTFKMTAGTISGNTSTDEGNGVYLKSSSSVFQMGGSAIVQPDGTGANDVYLPYGATIALVKDFGGDITCAARISPAEYNTNTTVLSAAGAPIENEYMIFAVTPQVTGEAGNQTTTNWYITNEGKLTTTDPNGGGGNVPDDFVLVTGATITTPPQAFGEYGAFKYVTESSPITIQNFYMCTHEVTQAEYETYCIYGGTAPAETEDKDQYPAYNINWYDAIVYCNLRSLAENLTPVYSIGKEGSDVQSIYPKDWDSINSNQDKTKFCGPDGRNSYWDSYYNEEVITINPLADGYRLPTNAEWEYAARGGNGLENPQTEFSGSSTLSEVSNGLYETIEKIMQHTANSLGIYDMNSAVNEWFLDPSGEDDYRRISTAQDPIDYNAALDPNERSSGSMKLGFRVVRNARATGGSNP